MIQVCLLGHTVENLMLVKCFNRIDSVVCAITFKGAFMALCSYSPKPFLVFSIWFSYMFDYLIKVLSVHKDIDYGNYFVHNVVYLIIECYRGYKRFFKRTLLEQSDYLKDDCLSVHCSVGVVKSHTEGPKVISIAVPPSNIGQQFGQLLENGKQTDVSFEVEGEVFAAHKLVLAARSPVFKAQLFGPMKDRNTLCIKVEDMKAPVFKVDYPFSICLGFPFFFYSILYICHCSFLYFSG